MKPLRSRSSRCDGAVMVFALLIILVGAVVLAGWVHLLATRAIFAEQATLGQKRRLALENGRQMAVEYVMENFPSGNIPESSAYLADGWGGFAITTSANATLSSQSSPAGVNPFSPGERWGYAVDAEGTVSDGLSDHAWTFRMRSRSPLFCGFPLTSHLPAASISGLITVPDASLLWSSSPSYNYSVPIYQAPGARSALHDDGAVLMGFPFVPLTSGNVGLSDPYAGYMDLSPSAASMNVVTDNEETANDGIVVSEDGSERTITLDLTKLNLTTLPSAANAVLRYQVDGSAGPGLTTVRLVVQGSTDANLPPLLIVYQPSALDLSTITLQNTNTRRLYFYVNKDTGAAVSISTASSLSWRFAATVQNAPVVFAAAGGLQITGGLRHNGNVSVSGGGVTIWEDGSPGGLEFMADRIGWLESFRQ